MKPKRRAEEYSNSKTKQCIKLFYESEKDEPFFKCKLCVTYKRINGSSKTNLVRHIETQHKKKYNETFKPGYAELQKLKLKRLKLIQSFTEIVTVNMRSFAYLTNTGFLSAIEDTLTELRMAGIGINVNDENQIETKTYLSQVANETRATIKEEVKGQFMSLMMDIGSKHNRSILGLTIRFFSCENVVERSIGMVEFDEAHTAKNIVKEILSCLKSYDIDPLQIIAITSDNAKNMKATIKHFDNLLGISEIHNDMEQCIYGKTNNVSAVNAEKETSRNDNILCKPAYQ